MAAVKLLQGARTQPIQTYLDMRQAIETEWVALHHIFGVCAEDMGYEGGGDLRVPWWTQAAEEKHLRVTLEEISVAARERWRQESGRGGEGKGGVEG